MRRNAGPEDEEPSGDKRLRQDVSQLVAVMFKQKMLTDKQRLFLLAQVGGRWGNVGFRLTNYAK